MPTRSSHLTPVITNVDLITLVIFVVAQVHVLQAVQMNVVATGNVRRGNVCANRDSWVQTAVSVHKELSVIKVSESLHCCMDVVALEQWWTWDV